LPARTFPETEAVKSILDAGRVPGDAVLVVHSAFRGLSRAGFDADRFIEALLARLPQGTLLMPAMTWRSVNLEQPVWDELKTAGHVGALAEVFRTRHSEARSIHPSHSVAGHGANLAALLKDHHVGGTPCPAHSPWGRLADADAFILLLGTGLESCTMLHHPEETLAPALYLKPVDDNVVYRCIRRDGTQVDMRMRRHLKLNRDFPQYDRRMGDRIIRGALAGTEWRLVRARPLMENAFTNLRAKADAHILPAPGA